MERKVLKTTYITGGGKWIEGSLCYVQKVKFGRAAKYKPSSEAQQKVNEVNAKRRALRLVQNNFVEGRDFVVHPTYCKDCLPETNERARKDVRNFILRVKRLYQRLGIQGEFKYFGTAVGGTKTRRHIHFIMTGDVYPNLADEIRKLWPYGTCNVDRLYDDGDAFSGIVSYVCENSFSAKKNDENVYAKAWIASRNLVDPEPSQRKGALPISLLPKIASASQWRRAELIESLYPGYEAVEISVAELSNAPEDRKYRIFGNYYIHFVLRKKRTQTQRARR